VICVLTVRCGPDTEFQRASADGRKLFTAATVRIAGDRPRVGSREAFEESRQGFALCWSRRFHLRGSLGELFIGNVDMIGKIGDDALRPPGIVRPAGPIVVEHEGGQ
jgi:hypothetical protein